MMKLVSFVVLLLVAILTSSALAEVQYSQSLLANLTNGGPSPSSNQSLISCFVGSTPLADNSTIMDLNLTACNPGVSRCFTYNDTYTVLACPAMTEKIYSLGCEDQLHATRYPPIMCNTSGCNAMLTRPVDSLLTYICEPCGAWPPDCLPDYMGPYCRCCYENANFSDNVSCAKCEESRLLEQAGDSFALELPIFAFLLTLLSLFKTAF